MKRKEDDETLKELSNYFSRCPSVSMAFLFGSRAAARARHHSDWDIGVYLTNAPGGEDRASEDVLWRDVERIVKSEIDLVILNRAPATLAWRIVREGVPLIVKDRRLFLNVMLRVSEEADAFYHTSREYHAIFERSASLGEGDRAHLQRIAEFLEREVEDYGTFKQLTWEIYMKERAKKREVEHWVEHLVNSAVDAAKIILASERVPIPETYAEILRALKQIETFSASDLPEQMAAWVKLRNVLAHEYLDYRWQNVSSFVNETEELWRAFTDRVKMFLRA